MTYSQETFRQFCHEAAKQFLQTVVVIDNEAIFDEKLEAKGKPHSRFEATHVKVKEPSKGTLSGLKTTSFAEDTTASAPEAEKKAPQECDQQINEKEPSENSHVLRAKTLIDGFADEGIICSVIRPDVDEAKVINRAVTVALAADIVVVDWMLGHKEGESPSFRAREIIKGIIERDLEKRGRLRLIAIYTAEEPVGVKEALYDHIKGLNFPHDGVRKNESSFSIQNSHLKIEVINKPSVAESPKTRPVKFEDLPDELLKLFSDLNTGLLPTIVLRSIAAIREETHHLLAVLHGKLDPALVGHRCLLRHPEDAEEFCDDLISGELRSTLAMKRIGVTYADKAAHKRWIGSRISDETPHKYKSIHLTRDQAFRLVENGDKTLSNVLGELRVDWLKRKLIDKPDHKDVNGQEVKIEKATDRILDEGATAAKFFNIPDIICEKTIPQLFDGNEARGKQTNLEFSRLCSLKREAFGLRKPVEGWSPRLTLGTILQLRDGDKDKFLLCLQPRCDSVRLEKDKSWNFPFLILEKAGSNMNIVIKAFDGGFKPVDKSLYYEPKPRNQRVYQFKSVTGDAIVSSNEGGIFKFKDEVNNEFWWIADLKDFVAQKIADEISTRIGSVGFDEYEWLRRKAR